MHYSAWTSGLSVQNTIHEKCIEDLKAQEEGLELEYSIYDFVYQMYINYWSDIPLGTKANYHEVVYELFWCTDKYFDDAVAQFTNIFTEDNL